MTLSRERIISGLLIIVGLVNFAPVVGVLGSESLARLYGFSGLEGDLLTLMRHRALLFGIVGAFIFCSVVRRHLQPAAMLMAAVSMLGYMLLVWLADAPGDKLYRVAMIDLIACVPLLIAILLYRRG
ncbi:MAG TPA: hypothetical protein VJN01_15185 [Xanthomonadales bacterium]|nr:hypothetical protein [Xanthomonadales bacterium]